MKSGNLTELTKPDRLMLEFERGWGEFSIEAAIRFDKKLKRIQATRISLPKFLSKGLHRRSSYEIDGILKGI